jgi:heme exporter protein D
VHPGNVIMVVPYIAVFVGLVQLVQVKVELLQERQVYLQPVHQLQLRQRLHQALQQEHPLQPVLLLLL